MMFILAILGLLLLLLTLTMNAPKAPTGFNGGPIAGRSPQTEEEWEEYKDWLESQV